MLVKNRRIVIAIAALTAITLILGYLNAGNMDRVSAADGSVSFFCGKNKITLGFDEITALASHEFKAVEDTSSSGPASRKYRGVLLKDVLSRASIGYDVVEASSKVIIKGLDGYVIALSPDEVLSDNVVYLAYEKDGKPLGSMKKGGSGPFQLIAKSDTFSQRWCKYVIEVSVE